MPNRSFVVARLFSFAPGFNLCETSALTPALPSLAFGYTLRQGKLHGPPLPNGGGFLSTNGCASPGHSAASCVNCVCGHIFVHGKSNLRMLYTRHTDTLRAPGPDCEQEKFPPRKNIGA